MTIEKIKTDTKKVMEEMIEVKKEALKNIKQLMEAYSENGNLYSEFEIEEDTTLYSYRKVFENGRSILINVSSGQRNCYIDSILYDEYGNEICVESVDGFLEDGDSFELEDKESCYKLKIRAC